MLTGDRRPHNELFNILVRLNKCFSVFRKFDFYFYFDVAFLNAIELYLQVNGIIISFGVSILILLRALN